MEGGFAFPLCEPMYRRIQRLLFRGYQKPAPKRDVSSAYAFHAVETPCFLRLKWKFPRPSPTRPLAVKSQKVKQSKTFPAPSEEPSHIQVYTKKIDPEENLSLTGAKLTYSDAEALRYWNGKPTSFEIPAYYSESAFGRNAGPALRRLLAGGFLTTGDIRKSIRQN